MNQNALLDELKTVTRGFGFNIIQTVKSGDYDSIVAENRAASTVAPFARSITLIGFGGNGFWEVLKSHVNDNPGFKELGVDIVDNYSVMALERLSKILHNQGIKYKCIFPFGENAMALDFVKLGQASGAGVPSILGILIHPEYGPWISLRGAIVSSLELKNYDTELTDFSPCPTCHKPCIDACPAKTVSTEGWDWESCMKFRLSEQICASNCASRRACPYGKDLQYSNEQLSHHHSFVLGSVREYFKENPS